MRQVTARGRAAQYICLLAGLLAAVPLEARADPVPSAHVADSTAVDHYQRLLLTRKPGTALRVEDPTGLRAQGDYAGWDNGALLLLTDAGDTLRVEGEDVWRVWTRERHAGTGATAGAIAGGVGGAGFGGFVGLLASALCETSDCPSPVPAVIVGALVGGTLGFAAGTVLGAIIGAAFPRWQEVGS